MKICVVLTARPSYAKWKTTLAALQQHPGVDLQIVVAASANLERYGRVRDVLEADGFPITAECWTVLEGATLQTCAKETGLAMMDLSSTYARLQPDVVCVMADRREILAAAAAAKYQGIAVAHMQGGEASGTIDGVVRHAVSHLADYHFPATELSAYRVYALTGAYERIFNYGCPSVDVAKQAQGQPCVTVDELGGAGAALDMGQPFGIVLQHPVTSEADHAYAQMALTLDALPEGQWLVLWPGQDAGAEGGSKAIRERHDRFHTVRNLPPERFLKLLTQASVLVGNSSCGIRESSYLGVPVVNIGSRQFGRERAGNVVDVAHDAGQIAAAIEAHRIALCGRQPARYPRNELYGRGDAGPRIAERLVQIAQSDRARASA